MRDPDDYTLRLSPTFVDGVLVSGASIADAVVVYSAATCVNEHVYKTLRAHDHGESLSGSRGQPRLVTTFADYVVAPAGAGRAVEQAVRKVVEDLKPGAIVLAELSRITIAGEDLPGLGRVLADQTKTPVLVARSRTLERDYTDAYRSVIEALAAQLPDSAFAGGPEDGKVAIVGYFFERSEGDQIGNVAAMTDLVRVLGLVPVAPWLSGAPFSALCEAARASVIAALPLGRRAARTIAERSGARVLDLDLPIGLLGTAAWVRAIGEATGRESRAEQVVDAALRRSVPLVDRTASRVLATRRAALAAQPDWCDGLARMLEQDLGMQPAVVVRRCRAKDCDPSVAEWSDLVSTELKGRGLDVIIGSTWERRALPEPARRIAFVELGYPSLSEHFLVEQPHLGFDGTLVFAQRLASAVLAAG